MKDKKKEEIEHFAVVGGRSFGRSAALEALRSKHPKIGILHNPVSNAHWLQQMMGDFKHEPMKRTFMDYATESIKDDLDTQTDKLIIEGLKRKGFEFPTRAKLKRFVKNRCQLVIFQDKEYVYCVDNVPFMRYKKHNTSFIETVPTKNGLSATLGEYKFV